MRSATHSGLCIRIFTEIGLTIVAAVSLWAYGKSPASTPVTPAAMEVGTFSRLWSEWFPLLELTWLTGDIRHYFPLTQVKTKDMTLLLPATLSVHFCRSCERLIH